MAPSSAPRIKNASGGSTLIRLCRNPISLLGLFLVVISLGLLLTMALFYLVTERSNPYLDIVLFLILPGVFACGLVIVPIGIVVSRLRRRGREGTYDEEHVWPRLDLNEVRTRRGVFGFLALTAFVTVPILVVSSYKGYVYTESTGFCADVCHAVMEPQAVAHARSAHARVACAECHIGAGASWFVRSKISGVRQVFAVWADSYSKPIPPAITELRPARETCEECHWPAQFFGCQYFERVRYSPDEQNSRRVVRLLLKTGGADEAIGRVEGIHMHMVLAGRAEFVGIDEELQVIPWVKYVDRHGEETIFRSDGLPASAPPPEGIRRTVDCVDCHNRGAHHFRAPQDALDYYLEAGLIEAGLPYVKREAVAALVDSYESKDEAQREIPTSLSVFYQDAYPAVWRAKADAIERAGELVARVYAQNVFPDMRVTWTTYPENVGHLYWPGCFRCHDGLHVADDGRRITSDCQICHVVLNPVGDGSGALVPGTFQHSVDLDLHQYVRCDQCHTGGKLLRCRECHAEQFRQQEFTQGEFRRTVPSTQSTSRPSP